MLWSRKKKRQIYVLPNVYHAVQRGENWTVAKQNDDGTFTDLKEFTYGRKNETLTRVGTLYQNDLEDIINAEIQSQLELERRR